MGLDRTGTFRCRPLEWGVDAKESKTEKGKLEKPNFRVRMTLTEIYDQTEDKWFDYSEWDAEITAFLYLYGKIKKKGGEIGPTLSMDQVKKVFSWDGRSMAQLANGKYSDLELQVRIGDNTYEEAKSPYQVDWIDVYDADPGRQLRKLDANELKELDKQFAALAAKSATPKAVAKAQSAPHPARVPADDVVKDTPEEKKRKIAEKSAKNKRAAKIKIAAADAGLSTPDEVTAPPAAVVPPPKPESKDAVILPPKPEKTKYTMQEAWETIVELRDPTINDKVIGEVWYSSIAEIAGPDAKSEDITPEQWGLIKEKTLESVAKF